MRQSTRLIANTLITYARMGLTVGMGLLVTRLALRELGDSDFGTLTTLGASGVLLLVLSDALTTSTQRHLAYEIGREDHDALRAVFNTALVIFAAVGLVVAAAGMGLWPALRLIIEIPEGRGAAAFQVYALTVATIVATIWATPFRGFLMARQSFLAIAAYDIAQAVLGLGAVLVLLVAGGDKLVVYAWLLLAVRVASEALVVLVTAIGFPDCRPRPAFFRRDQVRRIASFAGWSLFTQLAWRARVQGTTIVLNSHYGAGATAAYGVASQLGGYQNQIGAAVWRAVRPAITTIEARGADQAVRSLTLVSSKYLVLLTLFFLIPAELEMGALLGLWLENVPEHTAILARLVLVWTALNWASMGYTMAMEAKGNLGRYSVFMGAFDVGVIVAQIVALALAAKGADGRPVVGPWIMPAITVAIVLAQNIARAWYVGIILGIPLRRWATDVLMPCAAVAAIGAGAAYGGSLLAPAGPWRLLAATAAFGVIALPTIWLLALQTWEREHFVRVARGGFGMARRAVGGRRAGSSSPAESPPAPATLAPHPTAPAGSEPTPPAAM
jgi:O-antigen/teichoic acid export membrane protein